MAINPPALSLGNVELWRQDQFDAWHTNLCIGGELGIATPDLSGWGCPTPGIGWTDPVTDGSWWCYDGKSDAADIAGLRITSVEGIDASTWKRNLVDLASCGSVLGRPTVTGRRITITGQARAASCTGLGYYLEALDYGLRTNFGCPTCDGMDLRYLSATPQAGASVGEFASLERLIPSVGLLTPGLTVNRRWLAGSCCSSCVGNVAEITFQLGAPGEDIYAPALTLTGSGACVNGADQSFGTSAICKRFRVVPADSPIPITDAVAWASDCYPTPTRPPRKVSSLACACTPLAAVWSACQVENQNPHAPLSLTIELKANSAPIYGWEIAIYQLPDWLPCPTTALELAAVEQRDALVDLLVPQLPTGADLYLDAIHGRYEVSSGGLVQPASRFVFTNDGRPFRMPQIPPCTRVCVIVKASACATGVETATWRIAGMAATSFGGTSGGLKRPGRQVRIIGSSATLHVTPGSGGFATSTTILGSAGALTVTGTSGVFSSQTALAGSARALVVTGGAGAFSQTGTGTVAGSPGALNITGISGSFTSSSTFTWAQLGGQTAGLTLFNTDATGTSLGAVYSQTTPQPGKVTTAAARSARMVANVGAAADVTIASEMWEGENPTVAWESYLIARSNGTWVAGTGPNSWLPGTGVALKVTITPEAATNGAWFLNAQGQTDSFGAVAASGAFNGSTYMTINGPNSGGGSFIELDNIPVVPATAYTASYFTKQLGANAQSMGMIAIWYSGAGQSGFISSTGAQAILTANTTWQWVSTLFTPPAGANFMSLFITCSGVLVTGDIAGVDTVVVRTNAAQPAAPGSGTLVTGNLLSYANQDFGTAPAVALDLIQSAAGVVTTISTAQVAVSIANILTAAHFQTELRAVGTALEGRLWATSGGTRPTTPTITATTSVTGVGFAGFSIGENAIAHSMNLNTFTDASGTNTVPSAPQNVVATAGNAQATVTWTAPSSNGGSAINGYTVTLFPTGTVQTVGAGILTATFTGLTNGSSYFMTVAASNIVGTGPATTSNTVVPTTSGGGGGTPTSTTYAWSPALGAGGLLTSFSAADATHMFVSCDTYGGYRWNGAAWDQFINDTSMPAFGQPAGPARESSAVGGTDGTYAVACAPTNGNIVYVVFNDRVLKSTDGALHWLPTGALPALTPNINAGYPALHANYGTGRTMAPKMAVDPRDPNHVLLCSASDGMFRTIDGGTTWAKLTTIPNGTNWTGAGNGSEAMTGIVFDPRSAATGTRTSVAMVMVADPTVGGFYRTTDGAVTWTKVGAPANPTFCAGDGAIGINPANTATSIYFGTNEATNGLYRVTGITSGATTTSSINPNGRSYECVTAHPTQAGLVVAADGGGGLIQSTDGGATFGAWLDGQFGTHLAPAPEPGWLASAVSDVKYFYESQLAFWPGTTDLVSINGVGFFRAPSTTLPGSITWTSVSRAIEQFVSNHAQGVRTGPHAGEVGVAVWDQGLFFTETGSYPSRKFPGANGGNTLPSKFQSCWHFAVDPSNELRQAISMTDHRSLDPKWAGYSDDGGNSWTKFPTMPHWSGTVGQDTSASYGFGSMARFGSTIVWFGAAYDATTGSGVAQQPYVTTNLGTSWAPITFQRPDTTLVTNFQSFGGYNPTFVRHVVDVDSNGRFYGYGGIEGVWSSTNGTNWTRVFNGEIVADARFNTSLKAVPLNPGHLMFSSGHSDAVQYGDFMRSTDAGVTWTAITGFKEVHAWGYGEPLTVGAYPSILAAGWFNGVFGYWRSYDNAVTWQSISTIVPGHDFDYCSAIAGKWGTTKRGHFVVCFHGSGAAAGIPV